MFGSARNIHLYTLYQSLRPCIVAEVNLLRDIQFGSTKRPGGSGEVHTIVTPNEYVNGNARNTPRKEH